MNMNETFSQNKKVMPYTVYLQAVCVLWVFSFLFRINVHNQMMWSCVLWSWGLPILVHSGRKWWASWYSETVQELISLLVSHFIPWFPSVSVRPLWKRRWFTHSKVCQASSCPRLSRTFLLLLLLLKPPPSLGRPRSPWPFQLDLPRLFPQLWHNQPFCLAHPPLTTEWGAERDGGNTVEPGNGGESRKREREGDCLSRRNGRRRRCSRLCLVRLGYLTMFKYSPIHLAWKHL